MKTHLAARDLAWILAVVALWGFAFVPIKWALVEVPPFMLAALRFLLAAVPMCLFVRRPAVALSTLVGYGFAIGVCQFGLLFLGMKLGMPAGLSSLVIQVQVFFTMGLAVLLMGDRLQRHHIAGAAIAAAGVALLAWHKLAEGATGTLVGFALVLAAALAWGVGNLVAKRAAGADMFSLVVWSSLVPPLPLAALSYLFEGGGAPFVAAATMSGAAWGCVLFLAWGATLFGFASWNVLLHRYPTALISPFALLIPVSGLASGAIFLGETLAARQAVGVALVVAGLTINMLWPRVRRRLGTDQVRE